MLSQGRRDGRYLIRQVSFAIFLNFIIALILTVLGGDFLINIIFSQSIGLSIYALNGMAFRSGLAGSGLRFYLVTAMAIALGAVLGTLLARQIFQILGMGMIFGSEFLIPTPLVLGLIFGATLTYYFYSRLRLANAENRAKQEALQVLQKDRDLTEAQLKLVQAQIEPHFLFNTLANIRSLMDHDVATAQTMLDHLNSYLRTVLHRTRDGQITLGEEIDIVDNYLAILRLRMGHRLDYAIEVPELYRKRPFPPLLIQPLVENAIKHGLEPKVEGGRVRIGVQQQQDELVICVDDTGMGLAENPNQGIGLSNVRQRLRGLYGEKAQLKMSNRSGGGVSACLHIPLATHGESY